MAAAAASSTVTGFSNVSAAKEGEHNLRQSEFSPEFRLRIEQITPQEFADIVSDTAIDKSVLIERMGKVSYEELSSREQTLFDSLAADGTLPLSEAPPDRIYNNRFVLKEGNFYQVHLVQLG